MAIHWSAVRDCINISLQAVTIGVLYFAWRAADRQAHAAEKLTEATEQQIKTGQEQAKAAKEQVEVARRQITESLRPMLTCRARAPIQMANGSIQDMDVQNIGAGTALDTWWAYGKPGDSHMTIEPRRVQSGIIPPTREGEFRTDEARAMHEGVMIVYESLAGVVSASTLRWDRNSWVPDYIPDVTEWARTLLGRRLGPSS